MLTNNDISSPARYVTMHFLRSGEATTIAVPEAARQALFAADGAFVVNFNGFDARIEETLDGTASVLNPTARVVGGIAALSARAVYDCILTIEWLE